MTERGTGLPARLAGALLAALFLAPLLPLIPWSLSRGWFWPALLPVVDGRAWAALLDPSTGMLGAAATSAGVAAAVALVATAIAVPAGLALGRRRFRGKGLLELCLLAPAALPAIAVAMGLHAIFLRLGLAGSATGVALAHLAPTLPYAILTVTAAAAADDGRRERVARTLGAGPGRTFLLVTLPALMPGIATGLAFAFIVSWSQYGLTLLIGGGRVVTLPLILTQFLAAGRNDIGAVAAIVTVVPGVAVLALAAPFVTRLLPAAGRRG